MTNTPEIKQLGWAEPSSKTDPAYSRDLLSAYNALRTFESDFDRAQGQLRAIASAWLLAGIGAIGLLVVQEANHAAAQHSVPTGLPSEVAANLRQALLLIINFGITSIWKLDQKVYQNLLHNVFALGYWIEFKYLQVPPTRMTLYHRNYDITNSLSEFYSRPVLLIWLCASINLVRQAYHINFVSPFNPTWSFAPTLEGLLPTQALSYWGVCLVLWGVHTMHWIFILLQARTWGRLSGLLPQEADAAKKSKIGTPPRQPFAQSEDR